MLKRRHCRMQIVGVLFCSLIGKPAFFAASGVEHAQHNQDQFRLRRAAFYESKADNILAKDTALRFNLNIDGAPIASHAHTHLSPIASRAHTHPYAPIASRAHTHPSHLNPSPPLHFPLLKYPLPPVHLVCARLYHPPAISL